MTGAPYSATETLQRQQTLANGNQISTKEQSNCLPRQPGPHSDGRNHHAGSVLGQGGLHHGDDFRPGGRQSVCTRFVDDDRASVPAAEVSGTRPMRVRRRPRGRM